MSSQKQCHRVRKFEKHLQSTSNKLVELQLENLNLKRRLLRISEVPPRWKLKAYAEWKREVNHEPIR